MTRARKKKVCRRTKRTSMRDLPAELVGEEILTRVPITSLRAVRSTCKLWDALTKECVLGKKAAAREQFLGFTTKDSKVCSVRFHLCRSKDKEDKDLLDLDDDLVDVSIKQVDLLNQVEISGVFHCNGLLLCVAKDDSRLVVWNPYLGQTKWIRLRTDIHRLDWYALGYDINRSHKILRFLDNFEGQVKKYEIYEFSSNSWRVLDVTSDWEIYFYQGRVSVKGNTYFVAHKSRKNTKPREVIEKFLLCFDFTTERFGPRLSLPLPFHSYCDDIVGLSCVREEKLAMLYKQESVYNNSCNIVQIWVTTTIEPNHVSWSNILRVEIQPFKLTGVWYNHHKGGSFFFDEEEKIAVVFGIDRYHQPPKKIRYHTAFIIGEEGYFKSVSLGAAKPCLRSNGCIRKIYYPPFVCSSSYRQSLVQVNL